MKSDIPTNSDWGQIESDRDLKYAFNMFGGKSNLEMFNEFRRNVTSRTTDLKFMPEIPFKYYMLGFQEFIENQLYDRVDEPDVMNCFITLTEEKIDFNPKHIEQIFKQLVPTLVKICSNQDDFGVDSSIYGNFEIKLAKFNKFAELIN